MPDTMEQSLYKCLGGYDAVAAAVDDLLQRLHSDPQLGGYIGRGRAAIGIGETAS